MKKKGEKNKMVELSNFQVAIILLLNAVLNIFVFNIGYTKAVYDNINRLKKEIN